MRIALIGYGKMGRAVEEAAEARGHEVVLRIAPSTGQGLDDLAGSGAEVVVDFSHGAVVHDNVRAAAGAGLPIVQGTTAWTDDLAAVERTVREAGTALIHAPNFALGVHLFTRVVTEAARLLKPVGGYDVRISETHHLEKIDAPSGTAMHLAEAVQRTLDNKAGWVRAQQAEGAPGALPIESRREGRVPGTHEVTLDGPLDRIRLVHEAKDRSVFAAGAVQAAEWILGRTGVFTIDDLFRTTP